MDSNKAIPSRPRWLEMKFALVLGAGILLRFVPIALLGNRPLEGDAISYVDMAVRLLSGRPFELWWPPGLPLYLLPFVRVFGASPIVVMAAMIPWYVVASILLARVADILGGRRAAFIAVAILAVYPTYVFHSSYPFTPMPVATLLLALAYLLIRAKESNRRPLPGAVPLGLVVGAASLVRASSLSLILTFLINGVRSRKRMAALMVAVLTAGIVVFAWMAYAHRITGHWVPINYANTRNYWLGNNEWTPLYKTWLFGSHDSGPDVPDEYRSFDREILDLPAEERDSHYRRAAWDHFRERPDLFFIRTLNRIRCYFAFETATGTIMIKYFGAPKAAGLVFIAVDAVFYLPVLFGTILLLLLPSTSADRSIPILAVALGYALPYWFAFSHPSYHLPITPLGIACAAALAARLRSGETAWRRDLLPVIRSPLGGLLLLLAAYIQVEWVVLMFGRVAAIS